MAGYLDPNSRKLRTFTDERDRVWRQYAIEFDSPDGRFVFAVFALSMEHAAALVEDIKSSAKLMGELVEGIPTGESP